MFGRERLERKSNEQIIAMRAAGVVVARTLAYLGEIVTAGMRTGELDEAAREFIVGLGAVPSFPQVPGYRHTLCVSVGEQVVHGIPGDRVLAPGDLVSIDCGAIVHGWHGDAAVSLLVDGHDITSGPESELIADTQGSLAAGIAAMRPGNRVGDIGVAVQDYVETASRTRQRPYGIVTEYEGHGIGREMHMEPGVPNFATQRRGPKLAVGATLAIEPMVTLGSAQTTECADGWTAVTVDGSLAAHVEHTVAITPQGLWVLTALDGGEALLGAVGAPFAPLD